MNRPRPTRSKTGCSSCRRRKVRCDETKPVCNACTRLGLTCSYEPGRSASSSETHRYRVRFVSSRYTRSRPNENKGSPIGAVSPNERQQYAIPDHNREVPEDNLSHRSDVSQCETIQDNSPILHSSPTQALIKSSPQHDIPPKVIPDYGVFNSGSQLNSYEAPKDAGYVPAFFDLNMNFDLLGEDWLSPQTIGDEPPSEPEPCTADIAESESNVQGAAVVVGPDDHRLIQHYLNVMTNYAKIRCSGDENIYSHIFSNMALFYAPLYNALMAWTALHLGQTRGEPDMVRKAEERYAHAVSLTHRDQNVALHFEISIVTIWFALQFELLAAKGIETFCQHLEFAADLVDAHRRHQRAGGEATPLGHIGCRMLVWLGAYDSRASCIGGSGRLLQILESFRLEYDFIDAAFPNFPGSTDDLKPCLRLSLELDYMESRIVQLHRRPGTAPAAIWSSVQSGLIAMRERLEGDPSVAPIIAYITNPTRSLAARITTKRFNSLLLLATFYGVVITFHRMLPAHIAIETLGKLLPAEAAASYIIRLASWVCRFRPSSPQNIWPRLLFLAGIETTDLAYQDWAINALTDAEIWGANFRRTRLLLERIIDVQSTKGARVDYLDVMRRDTGLFII
ncbi:uncharacterized protein F4822DRAFT_325315 [Hypoxylon trugodes]|uniref:uncharacterized protein n=1 Tax=Hypoxylon trugodes TaxID=326681 RepID=UPI0021989858|nr:uncharacterized protein F4822DRAFT_325315 [Hypoxylon trugodes]KAI1386731.1 hypothetical protein F4822DRAFT_325315 [Hypoxylon trugodes]